MQIFNLDGPVFRFLEKIANLLILNLLFLICSIPIVTIGPALTAAYYVCLKMIRGEETSITKNFFYSFRTNFKQGTAIGIGALFLVAILVLDLYALIYLDAIQRSVANILIFIISLLCIVVLMILVYLFAILAQFDNKTSALIKWSALIAIRHFPVTLICVAIAALPFLILYFIPTFFFQILLPILILLGFSGITFLQSFFYVRVFRYYINSEEAEQSTENEVYAQPLQ